MAAVLDALYGSRQPTPDSLATHFRGERTPRWLRTPSSWAGDPRTGYTTSFDVLSTVGSARSCSSRPGKL